MNKKNKILFIDRQKNGSYVVKILIKNSDKPDLIDLESQKIYYGYTKKEVLNLAKNEPINILY